MGCICSSGLEKETKNEKKKGSVVNEVIFVREKNIAIEQSEISENIAKISQVRDDILNNDNDVCTRQESPELHVVKHNQNQLLLLHNSDKKLEATENSNIPEIKQNIKKDNYEFKIKVKPKEEMLTLWCHKGNEVKISVRGSYKLVSINEEIQPCGISKRIMPNGFALGAILLRIKGESNYNSLNLNNQLTMKPNFSGPIFVSFNIFNMQIESENGITIQIENVDLMSFDEIYTKLNVNLKNLNLNNYSEIEQEHFRLINHLRSNIKDFREIYLLNRNLDSDLRELIDNQINLTQFQPDDDLKKISDKFAEELAATGRFSHEDSQGHGASIRLRVLNGRDIQVKENIFVNTDPSAIICICKMLLDELSRDKENRKNLLDSRLNKIGLSIREHKKFKWIAVYNFSEL